MSGRIVCESCSQQRLKIKEIDSKVIPGMRFKTCNVCSDQGFEPRHFIIIALNQFGPTKSVKDLVNNKKYIGDVISLSEYLSVDK